MTASRGLKKSGQFKIFEYLTYLDLVFDFLYALKLGLVLDLAYKILAEG
jgi:hypothetical protein